MLPYWLLFSVAVYFAITRKRIIAPQKSLGNWSMQWWVIFFILVLMIGMRHEIGTDWPTYLLHIEDATGVPLLDVLTFNDPAYAFLNWVGGYWGGIYLVNTICAVLFAFGLLEFCRMQPLPWLALTVGIPFLVIVVAMGFTRQGVAIGIAMLAFVAIDRKERFYAFLWIGIAALFHKSALILMPMAALAGAKTKQWTLLWIGLATVLLFMLLSQESLDYVQSQYLEKKMESSGAAIRIMMNVFPATLFLLFSDRFLLSAEQKRFWVGMALSALMLVALLYASPSSTAVDRLGLYWIPLQIFVLSRLPVALGRYRDSKNIWITFVSGYSAAALFVWLMFADHAYAWLPYQFYPWEWLVQ